MIDQEKQYSQSLKISQREIALAMSEEVLKIQVLEYSTFDEYHATIDHEYIGRQDKFFRGHFHTPRNVFNHLNQHIDESTVQNSQLKVSYISGQMPQKRETIIQLVEQPANPNRKIIRMSKHFKAQLQQKDKRIQDLQLGFRVYKRDTSKMLKRIFSRMARLQKVIKKKERDYKALEERVNREEKQSKEMEERIHKEEKIVDVLCKFALKPIEHHPDNDHKQYYELINLGHSTKLTRLGRDFQFYNFANLKEVLPNQYKKYAIRRVEASALRVGFCTESVIRENSTSSYISKESVYYDCDHEGSLWKYRIQQKFQGFGVVNGEQVECVADLIRNELSWSKNGKVLVKCDLPDAMKGRSMFFSIRLFAPGDSVEVSSYE